jgi:opacity protein-like surface antigen
MKQLFLRMSVLLAALAGFALAADVTGTWKATFDTQVGAQEYTFVFKQEGSKLTGKANSAFAKAETAITEGSVNGDDITFVEDLNYEGMPLHIVYKGKISGNEIKFVRDMAGFANEEATAKKQ